MDRFLDLQWKDKTFPNYTKTSFNINIGSVKRIRKPEFTALVFLGRLSWDDLLQIIVSASPSFAIPLAFAVLISFLCAKLSLEATGCNNSRMICIISYM